jgi:hypothetical protein
VTTPVVDWKVLKAFSDIELQHELDCRRKARNEASAVASSHGGTKRKVSFDIVDRFNGTSEMMCSINPDYLRHKKAKEGLIGCEHLAYIAINAVQEAIARMTANLLVPKPDIIRVPKMPKALQQKKARRK